MDTTKLVGLVGWLVENKLGNLYTRSFLLTCLKETGNLVKLGENKQKKQDSQALIMLSFLTCEHEYNFLEK